MYFKTDSLETEIHSLIRDCNDNRSYAVAAVLSAMYERILRLEEQLEQMNNTEEK